MIRMNGNRIMTSKLVSVALCLVLLVLAPSTFAAGMAALSAVAGSWSKGFGRLNAGGRRRVNRIILLTFNQLDHLAAAGLDTTDD